MKSADMPAMPVPLNPGEKGPGDCPPDGLTKREYFAAMAMQGIVSSKTMIEANDIQISIRIADALLASLENN